MYLEEKYITFYQTNRGDDVAKMPSVGLSVTTVHLLFPARYCFPILQMLFSNHILSASFGFAFSLVLWGIRGI